MTLMQEEKSHLPPTADGRYRFTVAVYEQMARSGAFEGKRVELVEGEIYEMTAMLDPHIALLFRLTRELPAKLPLPAGIASQVPIRVRDEDGSPEPDFVVTRGSSGARPNAEDIAFVLEISDSTLRKDRGPKLRTYARAGIQDYWLINLNTDPLTLEVYRQPDGEEYLERKVYKAGQSVAPLEFPDIPIRWW